jgi:hypothetical protein
MKTPWHTSLLAKMLGWLALHLIVLVAAFVLFVNLQLRVGLDSLLSGRTGERLRDLGELIGHDLRSSPRAEWNAILADYTVRRIEIPYTRYSANTKKEKEGRKEVLELLYVIRAKV